MSIFACSLGSEMNQLKLNGHHDWFLPSIDELQLLYSNLHIKSLGDFNNGDYWSSSSTNTLLATTLDFSFNQISAYARTEVNQVRAVREF